VTSLSTLGSSISHVIETLTALGDAVIVTTLDGTIVVWSAAAEEVLGWQCETVTGDSLVTVLDPSPASAAQSATTSFLAESQWQGGAIVSHRSRGRIRVHLSLTQITLSDDGASSPRGLLLRVRPWPERARQIGPDELDPDVLERALEHVEDVVLITALPVFVAMRSLVVLLPSFAAPIPTARPLNALMPPSAIVNACAPSC
jgi:PAS domain S-box-containing protein